MNIYVQISESLLSVFWGVYLEVEILDHINSVFSFQRNYRPVCHGGCAI